MTASYDQLNELTGKLKRSAIDSFMKSQEWIVYGRAITSRLSAEVTRSSGQARMARVAANGAEASIGS